MAQYKTISQVRAAFWYVHTEFKREYKKSKKHNDYNGDVQFAFSVFVDGLKRDGFISDSLAKRVTL